jgi:hypothetical protein
MTEQLETPAALPTNASEARTILDARKADPSWGAKVLAGHPEANREWRELTSKAADSDDSVVAAVMSGEPSRMPTTETHIMAGTAGWFRELGISDQVISEFLRGQQATAQEYEAVKNWKLMSMGDKSPGGFVERILSGDVRARQQMMLADTVLVNGAKESKAA